MKVKKVRYILKDFKHPCTIRIVRQNNSNLVSLVYNVKTPLELICIAKYPVEFFASSILKFI